MLSLVFVSWLLIFFLLSVVRLLMLSLVAVFVICLKIERIRIILFIAMRKLRIEIILLIAMRKLK